MDILVFIFFLSSNQPNNKSKRVNKYKEYKYIFLILGILFIIFGIYLIFKFNPLKILNVVLYREKKSSIYYSNMNNLITYVIHYTPSKKENIFN